MKVYIVIFENKQGISCIDEVFLDEDAAKRYRQEQVDAFPNYFWHIAEKEVKA